MGRRLRLSFAITSTICLAAWAGCTRETPGFCCSELGQCAAVGAGDVVLCPSGERCDDDGQVGGVRNSCVVDPDVTACEGPDDCEASEPACPAGICVECDRDELCGDPTAAVCDLDLYRCVPCSGDDDCDRFGADSTCNAGICVQCEPTDPASQSSQCPADEPICGADATCRPCVEHAECDSGACGSDGACVDADDIAYVTMNGSGDACTAGDPCAEIELALATGRAYVVIGNGMYMEDLLISDGRSVSLIGPTATVVAETNLQPAIAVTGNQGTVALHGLTLTTSDGGAFCDSLSPASTARLILDAVTITGNTSFEGVRVSDCDVIIRRSLIVGNGGGGINIQDAAFDITNTVIADNGATATWGGVRITNPRAGAARLAFNTIVGNRSTTTGYPGIACTADDLPPFTSNIVAGNTGRTDDEQLSLAGCSIEHSLIEPPFAGDQNVDGDPLLDSEYRLGAGSPAIDQARYDADVPTDRDGDVRPSDAPDIGADERIP